jgi:hypothetical protein
MRSRESRRGAKESECKNALTKTATQDVLGVCQTQKRVVDEGTLRVANTGCTKVGAITTTRQSAAKSDNTYNL